MARREGRGWDSFAAIAAVIVVEVACAAWLARFRAPRSERPVVDDAIVVAFIARPPPKPRQASVASHARPRPREQGGGATGTPASGRSTAGSTPDRADTRAGRAPPARLDLRVPAPDDTAARRFAPFDGDRPRRLANMTTRFDGAWRGGGTVLDEARRRSPVLAVALSLFGGPGRHCNEVERRLRKPDCLPEDDAPPEP